MDVRKQYPSADLVDSGRLRRKPLTEVFGWMWLLPLYTLILFSPLIPSLDSLLQEVEVFGIGHTGHDTPERISNLQRVRFRAGLNRSPEKC